MAEHTDRNGIEPLRHLIGYLPGKVNSLPTRRLPFAIRLGSTDRKLPFYLVFTVAIVTIVSFADSAEPPPPALPDGKLPALLRTPTMGGKQFWSDQLIQPPWRIQRHVLTGVCRLLDGSDRAVTWGNYNKCLQQFQQLNRQERVPPLKRRIVVVLHGAIRSRSSMAPLCRMLENRVGYTAINVSYASTRAKIAQHADSLHQVIEHLAPQVDEINFVAHSMGNLVIRHYLRDQKRRSSKPNALSQIRRIVMLAPPNQGTQLAARVKNNPIFRTLWGVSGGEMAAWKTLEPHLGIPECEFGIIAGDPLPAQQGNPLIEGPDDLVVGVSETQLPGARDFLVLPVSHSSIMHDERVQDATLRFLQRGHFRSPKLRQPIPSEAQTASNPDS